MKYVLAAGHSVVSELFNEKMYKGVKFTTDTSKAIQFDNKTDAEKASVFANTILGTNLIKSKEM
jgi:hypothetical protein